MPSLLKMNADEFARRLRADSEMRDKRFAIFLGAGCSISSNIPGAGSLVKDSWIPRLQEFCAPEQKDTDAWAKHEFREYDPNNPAGAYGTTMERLFLNPEDRQREIERLCDGKFPGFGYAVLATLISRDGGSFNVVITTNFDDLVSDALYLFTNTRPLVIGHESLAGFIRPTRTRPLVVKLHGDARLTPLNTIAETAKVQEEVERQIQVLLNDRGLIIMGYGGNDQGIRKMFEGLPKEALPFGIYWVSGSEPQGVIRPWLEERRAVWVEKSDFDETMLLIRDAFDLAHPDHKLLDNVFQNYAETYKNLSNRIRTTPIKSEDEALRGALERADEDLESWISVSIRANKFEKSDPDEADKLYQDGLEKYPKSAPLLGNYAIFLKNICSDFDKAEQYYQRALAADPNHANNLGNYANLLKNIRKDYDKAEEYYKRALEIDSSHAANLGNYASFLADVRKDYDKAEEFYKHALEIAPNHATNLGIYASFLTDVRKDYDKAEEFYKHALEIDPNHATNLGNYANFLTDIRKDSDKAETFYQRELEANPNHAAKLGNYISYLIDVRKDYEKADQLYQRALEVDPNDTTRLGNLECVNYPRQEFSENSQYME